MSSNLAVANSLQQQFKYAQHHQLYMDENNKNKVKQKAKRPLNSNAAMTSSSIGGYTHFNDIKQAGKCEDYQQQSQVTTYSDIIWRSVSFQTETSN